MADNVIMRRLRKVLLHSFVWLTAASTLLAGTPQVQCACAGPVKALGSASAGDEPCCCCTAKPNDESVPPSCCHPSSAPKDDLAGPTIRQNECRKVLVRPAAATVQRTTAPCLPLATLAQFALPNFVDATVAQGNFFTTDLPLPPPVDVHLVLQHFLI